MTKSLLNEERLPKPVPEAWGVRGLEHGQTLFFDELWAVDEPPLESCGTL